MLKARYGWMAVGLAVLVGWCVGQSEQGMQKQTAQSAEEIAADNAMRAEMKRIIRAHGYNCPDVKRLEATGPVPLGKQFKVWCGPEGSPGTYPRLVYEAVMTPQKRMIVVPWKD